MAIILIQESLNVEDVKDLADMSVEGQIEYSFMVSIIKLKYWMSLGQCSQEWYRPLYNIKNYIISKTVHFADDNSLAVSLEQYIREPS